VRFCRRRPAGEAHCHLHRPGRWSAQAGVAMDQDGGEARKLGPFLATVIVAGNMIGSGVFLLPATLGAIGSISLVGWIVSGAGALALAGVFAILGRLRHAEGGMVGYVRDALGPFAAFQATLLYWLNIVVGNVALALAVV